jgi:DNA-binding response OmpR family regulator
MRVLVVEDQKTLANRIAEGLRDQGMAVDVAYDGAAAVEVTAVNRYDVVVLDRDLPRVHGTRSARAWWPGRRRLGS